MNHNDTDEDEDAFHSPAATDNEKTPQASPTSGQLLRHDEPPVPSIALPASVREEDEESATATTTAETATAPAKPSAGGWSGWGSFLSSAVSAVAESLQSDVDSFMDTAKGVQTELTKATEKTVDRVYTVLDAPGDGTVTADSEDNHALSDAPAGESASKAKKRTAANVETTGILQSTETVLQVIDKTFDYTSDLLGNAVVGGYKQIESAKLGEKLGGLTSHVGRSDVINQSKEVGGTLLAHGLTALEAIGSVVGNTAAETLAKSRGLQNGSAVKSGGAGGKSQTARVMTLLDYFEDNCGNAHLQALEMLSTEASVKGTALKNQTDALDQLIKSIEEKFDLDDVLEDLVDASDSVLCDDEGYKQAEKQLDVMGVNNKSQLSKLRQFLQQHIERLSKEISENDLSELPRDDPDDAKKYIFNQVKSKRQAAMKDLADLAEKSCEQMLRISEIFLMRIAEEKLKETADAAPLDSIVNYATALRELTIILLTELQILSVKESSNAANFVNACKVVDFGETFDAQLDKQSKDFEAQTDMDLSQAMSYVQEASNSNLAILKLMALSWSNAE